MVYFLNKKSMDNLQPRPSAILEIVFKDGLAVPVSILERSD